MTIILSASDYYNLQQESRQTTQRLSGLDSFDVTWDYPKQIGKGYTRYIQIRDGLAIRIREFECRDQLLCDEHHPESPPVFLTFCLAGDASVQIHNDTKYQQITGQGILEISPGIWETETWHGNKRVFRIQILISLEIFRAYGTSHLQGLSPGLQQFLEGKDDLLLLQPGIITPQMKLLLWQILHCSRQGLTKQIYLEGLCLELIALHLEQAETAQQQTVTHNIMKSRDRDRVYQAQDILIRNLENPPSLLGLAEQVGLNERKLRRDFQKIFGKTVFEYLHDYRMEQAQFLLVERPMSVTEIAYTVGYANVCTFSSAFRKKFGVSPRDYQLGKIKF